MVPAFELGGLLGWEGSFADLWSNRSRHNAAISASINVEAPFLTLALCIFLTLRQREPGNHRLLIIPIQLGLLLALVLKTLALNGLS
jgi:hypothetical protein